LSENIFSSSPRRPKRRLLAAVFIVLLGICTAAPEGAALADELEIRSVKKSGKMDKPQDKMQKKNLQMTEIEILGEFEKPKTMFVVPRAPHEYHWGSPTVDFTDEILLPISKQRVEGMQQWREEKALP